MKYIKVSYKNHSKLYNILFIGISLSITLGLLISMSLDKDIVSSIYNYFLNNISNYNKHIFSNIIYPILVYLIIFISSTTIIGFFIPILAIFIENMSIGLLLGVLIRIKAIKGLLFGLIYFVLTKLIYLIILLYLIINIFKFIRRFILSIKNKTNDSIYNLYSNIIIKVFCSISVICIYNLINIITIPKILNAIAFLL